MENVAQYLRSLPASCNRQEWIEIGGAFKSAGGDFGTFDAWSQSAPEKYDAADCRRTWDSLTPSGNPEGAAAWLRKKSGASFPVADRRTRTAAPQQLPPAAPPPTPGTIPPPPPPPKPAPVAAGFTIPPRPAAGGFKALRPGTPEMARYIETCAANTAAAQSYFCGQRGLSPEIVSALRLGFDAADRAAVIPYPPGEPSYCVRRFAEIPPDGHGGKYDNPNGQKVVFNSPALQQQARPIFVLEGQIDALSILDAGGQACSGTNEQGAFLKLAAGSPAASAGFIIVADADEHGRDVAANLAEKLRQQKIAVIVTEPPAAHDINEFLRAQGREALAAWIAQQENALAEKIAPAGLTLRELQDKIRREGADDPNELIKNRFLCRGGAALLAAETGCGKSSLIMQIALFWGAGLPCFGLVPTKPLRILIIQAENDLRDLHEEITGICRGAAQIELLAEPQIAAALDQIKVVSDAVHSGDAFLAMLDGILKRNPTDLVFVDPIFAFAGFDLNDQGAVSKFFRNGINPLLQTYRVAALAVHHQPKPPRGAMPGNGAGPYSFHGSAELVNWARACLILERCKDRDGNQFFKLTVPKRGRRLGWGSDTKYLAWANDFIFWEELPSAPEMAPPTPTPETRAELREREKQRRLIEDAQRAAEILRPGQAMTAADFRRAIAGRLGITNKDKIEGVIAVCLDRGAVVERPPTPEEKTSAGVRRMFLRPEEPPEQPEIF